MPKQGSSDPETSAAVLHRYVHLRFLLRDRLSGLLCLVVLIYVLNSLQVITQRLIKIEETLSVQARSSHRQSPNGSSHSSAVGFDHDMRTPVNGIKDEEAADPVSMVTSAIRGLSGTIVGESPFSSGTGSSEESSPHAGLDSSYAQSFEPDVPDAISRGFVSIEEAQQLFDL